MDAQKQTLGPVRYRHGAGSDAAILGHPVHPMIVPLVIGTYVAAVFADFAFAQTHDPFWGRSVSWLLAGSLFAGIVAAIPGAMDFLSLDRARNLSIARMHAAGNAIFLVLVAINFERRQPDPGVMHSGELTLSILGLVLLAFSGWLGGALAYQHGIGVSRGIGMEAETLAGGLENSKLARKAELTPGTAELRAQGGLPRETDPATPKPLDPAYAQQNKSRADDQAA